LAAKTLHLHYNATGRLLDLFADMLLAAASNCPALGRVGTPIYGRLSENDVRSIRKSPEKVIWLALEYGVSAAMIVKIRGRKIYRWVSERK
jgi:hypothetical protein